MTELGIRSPLVRVPCFTTFHSMIPNQTIISFCLFTVFVNVIMTGEPKQTTSKKRTVPDLMFLSEHIAQLLQVFAIEFSDFVIEFVPFAIEFVTFAIEFVPFAIEFIAFAIEFVPFAIEFVAFAIEFVLEFVGFAVKFIRIKNGSWRKHENMM